MLEGTGPFIAQGQGGTQHQHHHHQQQQFDFRHKKRKKEHESDNYDPLCPTAEGYDEYRDQVLIQRSTTNSNSNHNIHVKKKKKSSTDDQSNRNISWYYQDQSGIIQGPFHSSQMVQWKEAGFFQLDTLVRIDEVGNNDFHPMGSVDLLTGYIQGVNHIILNGEGNDDDRENGILDRIAALKGGYNPPKDSVAEIEENQNDDVLEKETSGEPSHDDEPELHAYPTECALGDHEGLEEGVPYPSDVAYPVDDEDDGGFKEDIPYPVDDDAYEYPNTDAAYDDAYNDDDNYVAPYYYNDEMGSGNIGHSNGELEKEKVSPPKKKYDGDMAVVGFVPSHLQVRRGIKKNASTK